MSLEASIAERLQELRKWQINQHDRLLKQQQEQRYLLSIEQKRMYEALGLSMDDIDVTLMDELSLTKIQEHLESLPETGDKSDALDESSQYKSFQITEIKQPAVINSTESSDELSGQRQGYQTEKDNFDMSAEAEKHVTPFAKRFSTGGVRIDDMPVPSPKKDFKTLLEEKLKDSDALGDNSGIILRSNIKKQPFLRKGEGLARFRMNKTPNTEKISKSRAKFLPPVVKSKSPAVNREINQRPKEKITKINKNSGISRRNYPLPKVAQQKLNLKNLPLPKNKIQRSISPLTKPSIISGKNTALKSISVTKKISNDEFIGSDLDSSKLETKMFELLEEKAENSSFCSTSSAVVAFLQQSTPLKLKSIRKNLVMRKSGSQARKSKIIDDEIDELVHSLKSNRLQSAVDKPKWNSGPFVNESSIDNNISSTPKTNFTERRHHLGRLDGNFDGEKMVETATETDTESEKNYEDCQRFVPLTEDKNLRQVENNGDDDGSMHVRFSEYNEYKMIGLTDTSTISRDSFVDDKNWTDDSSVESSELEILTRNFEKIQQQINGMNNRDRDGVYESTDDEQSIFNETESTVDGKDDTITEIKNSVDVLRNCNENNEEFNKLNEEEFNKLDEEKNDLILKSELLKNRLLELEREIEIFRKENAALSEQRQKLNQERRDWEKELKEKEDNLRREQMEAENNLQEEKRRMAREKAALENRLRDAREKSIQAKQDRQEIDRLKDQLAELKDNFSDKENLWLTEQARQRSQIRVLQMENGKFKQEISKFQENRQSRLKKPSVVLQAKNSSGQSNKTEVKKINFDDQVENNLRKKEHELEPEAVGVKYSPDKILNSNFNFNRNLIETTAAAEDVEKKRELYKNLIKEAAGEYYDEDIENIPDNFVKIPEKPKILTPTYRKSKIVQDNFSGHSNQATQTSVELKSTVEKNEINKRIPRLIGEDLQLPHGSYQQFVREVINPTTTQYSQPASKGTDVQESRQVQQELCVESRVPVSYSPKYSHESSTRSPEVNGGLCIQAKQTPNYVADRRINQTKFVDDNESDISPRVEKIPLPRPTDNATPCPDSIQVSRLSDLTTKEKISVPTKQSVREVLHPDGHLEYWYPNGNVKKVFPDSNTSKMIYYNGDRREYPDGTVKFVYNDGTQETRYANGRIRIKDRDGHLLFDSHHPEN
ncbi:hypothetical protein G9C98_006923 [Cotesia typhae]|uniref:Centromere protein J C-terminal domain-containing protein n=1 Tax=Cotesia typhae TaxID=2053667 RepID=A0A8J5UPR0_9HYME|nr:hypothetical protein G9C98_006923 [Cotesia typhae]